MQISVQNKGDLGREMVVTLPAQEVDTQLGQRLDRLAKSVKLDGFRPGKAPVSVVKARFGAQALAELTEELVSNTLSKAFKEQDLQPAAQPRVTFGTMQEGKDYSYSVQFDVLPTVEPKGYAGLKLTRHVAEPSTAQLTEVTNRLRDMQKTFSPKEAAAVLSDRVLIDAVGFKDGTAFDGGEVKQYWLELGSGSFIPGFEEGLVGVKKGDSKKLDLAFPQDYFNKDLAAQKVTFDVAVFAVEAGVAPDLDDDFAKKYGAPDVAALQDRIKADLVKDLTTASDQRLKREMFDVLVEKNTFPLPASMVDEEFTSLWHNFVEDLKRRGGTLAMLGKPEKDLQDEYKHLAARRVQLGLLMTAIGNKEKITLTEKDIQDEINAIAQSYGPQADKVKTYYNRPEGRSQITGPLYEKKVCALIYDQATITESTIDAQELRQELSGE